MLPFFQPAHPKILQILMLPLFFILILFPIIINFLILQTIVSKINQ